MSSAFSASRQCRLDPKYLIFAHADKWKAFESKLPSVRLGEILNPLTVKKVAKGELDNEALLINIADQEPGNGVLNTENIKSVDCIGSDKIDLSESDIIISKLGMSRGYIFPLPKTNQTILGSSEFIPYRVKNNKHLPYYVYLLLNKTMLQTYARLETGKTPSHKRVNPNELLKIEIPCPDDETIDNIVPIIDDTVKKINEARNAIRSAQSIINEVFAREFGFDYAEFERLKAQRSHTANLSAFADNPDLRCSSKFHRTAGEFVIKQLTDITDKKIKHYLAEPIALGASVSPNDYFEDGEYYYISMATIKNWAFDSNDSHTLSDAYSRAKQTKTVSKDDILIARSGEGTIGKVAFIEDEDLHGIFSDFIMRVRLRDYNIRFACCYLRTSYFQYLIEVYKKGLGNNTNIFPTVIQEFPIIDISLAKQQCIVDEIQSEIAKQDEIKAHITDLRRQIDRIIEGALTETHTVH
jgi:restriction endonuclease S subunit